MRVKQCPHCRNPFLWIARVLPPRGIFTKYQVVCVVCHRCGKPKIGKRRAIEAWNKMEEKNDDYRKR